MRVLLERTSTVGYNEVKVFRNKLSYLAIIFYLEKYITFYRIDFAAWFS